VGEVPLYSHGIQHWQVVHLSTVTGKPRKLVMLFIYVWPLHLYIVLLFTYLVMLYITGRWCIFRR